MTSDRFVAYLLGWIMTGIFIGMGLASSLAVCER